MNFLLSHCSLSQRDLPGVDGTKGLICGRTVSDQALIINEGESSYEGFAGQVAVTLDVTHYPLACVNALFPKPEVGSHSHSTIK